jgi:shikimate dehydrogenase
MDVYGLLGNPVGHSLSPPMHEAAYEALGMDARYVTFEPDTDPETLAAALSGADALGVAGLNVTVPFKQTVMETGLVDPDDRARRIGAVNTVDFGDSNSNNDGDGDGDGDARPTGHNTDAEGTLRALREADVPVSGASAVLVGAGGAGRAIAVALAEAGATVTVCNRTVARAEALVRSVCEFAAGVTAGGLSDVPDALADADLLVNATTVGMEEDVSPVPKEAIHADLTVMDAVYQPRETRLLRDATAAGADTVDGSRMLLYQGVAAFELWTGRSAPVDAMDRALTAALG